MNTFGLVCNQGMRTFRLCCKNTGENQIPFKRHFSLSPGLYHHYKNPISRGYFSISSIVESVCKCKSLQELRSKCNEKFVVLGEILTKQFNFYASQRIRRMSQVWNLYTRLYNETTLHHMFSRFVTSLRVDQKRPFTFLLGVSLFSWEKEKITECEIQSSVCEIEHFQAPSESLHQCCNVKETSFTEQLRHDGWEAVIQKEQIQLWRKAFPDSYLFEYKIFGTFFDVPARAFFSVQTDIEYRKKWDKLVIKLDVIDKGTKDDCEVVHWVMHYPYPMYSREYVYIRRAMIDPRTNTMTLVSRAVDHPECPVNKKHVRVSKYSSRMVIRPHRTFDENGFDYILTYFDDPQAAFPSAAYNWMASSGVPDFVEKLHEAARHLHFQQKRNTSCLSATLSGQPCPSGEMEYAYM